MPDQRPLGHDRQARHGRHQPSAGGAGGSRRPQGGGNAVDAAIADQRGDRRRRADELRHRRRPVRHRLGRQDAEALRPQRQRPQPVQARRAQVFAEQGLDADSRRRAALLVGARLRGRLGRAAQQVRHASRWPSCSQPAIAATPKKASRSARSSPATGRRGEASWPSGPTRRRRYLLDGTRPAVGRGVQEPGPGRARYRADRRRTAATPSTRATIAEKIVAFSEQNGGYFSLEGLRRPHVRLGRAGLDELPRLRRLGAAAARARASPRCRCSTCSKRYDLQEARADSSPDYWHLLVEAKKLAFADRAKFYADPAFAQGAGRRS